MRTRGFNPKLSDLLATKLATNQPSDVIRFPVERRQGGREPRTQAIRPPADRA
jgi:hypothetical protein